MLSQSEIDALLSGSVEAEQRNSEVGVNLAELMGPAMPGGKSAPAEKSVRPYNFWSPERFSKEQMRAVELVHESLAERLTTSLPPYLRTEFRPRVVHIEQGRADDFLKDLPAGTLFHVLLLDPLPGRMVLVIGQDLTWLLLERLLGGTTPNRKKPGVLTDIGQSLIKGMVEYMLNDIKAAWAKVVTLEPKLEDSTTNHHWVQMMMGNARVMLVSFEITLGDVTGTMGIYIPFSMLKPVANVLNPHVWIAGLEERRTDDGVREKTVQGLQQIYVPLRVMLGSAELTCGELLALSPGDVIPLDTPINKYLEVNVGDRPHFEGQVGTIGQRLAIQITALLTADRGA